MNTQTELDKASAMVLDYGRAKYQRGFTDGLKIAEQIEAWLTAEGDVSLADVHQWAVAAITKAKESLSNGTN